MRRRLGMGTQVKICGIKTRQEIECVNQFPVQYMGFIFAPSKRQITPELASELRKQVREDILVVGVFVNESLERIEEIIKKCELDIVQLHGEESVEFCTKVSSKVWKSISIKNEKCLKSIEHYAPVVDGLLLDTYSKEMKGGTGKAFNWALVSNLSKTYPIILAGGLTPHNIREAIDTVHPQIVDVNSGVETELVKDWVKISQLFGQLTEVTESKDTPIVH